jgi:hypothetical protein
VENTLIHPILPLFSTLNVQLSFFVVVARSVLLNKPFHETKRYDASEIKEKSFFFLHFTRFSLPLQA